MVLVIIQSANAIPIFASSLSDNEEAIEIAEYIRDQNLIGDENWIETRLREETLAPAERLHLLRGLFTTAASSMESSELITIAKEYEHLAKVSGNERDRAIADLFIFYASSEGDELSNLEDASLRLERFATAKDWFVKHRANSLAVASLSNIVNPGIALNLTDEAFKLIPDEQSEYVTEARILSLVHLSFLHTRLKNRAMGVQSTRDLIDIKQENDFPVDGKAIIKNLVYAFESGRDHNTAVQLAQILLDLEASSGATSPGLTQMQLASLKNNLGDYPQAYSYAETALTESTQDPIKRAAELHRITALAGMGNSEEANIALKTFLADLSQDEQTATMKKQEVIRIKALIALHEGRLADADALYNQRVDLVAEQLLNSANQKTPSQLAALQNTQDRVPERETSFQRESDLPQRELEKQTQVNRLFMALLGILAAALFGVIAFTGYKIIMSRRLEKSANLVVASEKSKSEFLALMSQELRTPLNGIIGLAGYLAMQAPTQDVREKTSVILKSGHDLLSLVENILDMTLIEAGELHLYPEEIDIRPIVEKSVAEWNALVKSDRVTFTWHIDPTVPGRIILDPKRTQQCLDQLLSNAVKFTEHGRIHLHVLGEQSEGAPKVQIIVADTGIGITEFAKPRLFKPFVQADTSMTRLYGGAGLGLAITRSLAQMMGGDVIVNSNAGRGSEFILTLQGEATVPAALPVEQPEKAVPVLKLAQGEIIENAPEAEIETVKIPRRILVVEDDVASQDVLRSLLEPAGCNVICVPNGNFAIEALNENIFDLVLMDIRMPAMNGIETTREIRASEKAYSQIPIIAVTADASQETRIICENVGMNSYLAKPISARKLFEAFDGVGQSLELRRSA